MQNGAKESRETAVAEPAPTPVECTFCVVNANPAKMTLDASQSEVLVRASVTLPSLLASFVFCEADGL